MSRPSMKLAMGAVVGLAVVAVGASVGQDVIKYESKPVALAKPTKKNGRRNAIPYKNGTRFIITIESPDFSVPTQVTGAVLNDGTTKVADWTVISQIQDINSTKITVVFMAVDPRNAMGIVPAVAGTGTIIITTSNGSSTTTTDPGIPVEPVNIDTCP